MLKMRFVSVVCGVMVGVASSVATAGHGGLFPADQVRAQYPGELGRLAERLTEERYRSGDNVYRQSRQYSGLRNPFRSSRHYARRVANSYNGFHVRTHVHRPLREVIVDHRLRFGSRRAAHLPLLHGGRGYGYGGCSPIVGFDRTSNLASVSGIVEDQILEDRYDRAQKRLRERQQAQRQARDTAQAATTAAPARPATEVPVMHRIEQEDGSVKWIMTSVPVDEVGEEMTASSADNDADDQHDDATEREEVVDEGGSTPDPAGRATVADAAVE